MFLKWTLPSMKLNAFIISIRDVAGKKNRKQNGKPSTDKIDEKANSVYPDETARISPHQDLHCLQNIFFWFVEKKGLKLIWRKNVSLTRVYALTCSFSWIIQFYSQSIFHRRLGVTLTSNNQCTKHRDSVIASASHQLSYLREVKCRFSNGILKQKLYCTYLRPAKSGTDVLKWTRTVRNRCI